MHLWTWRSTRRLLLLALLVFCAAPSVRSQEPPEESVWGQREVRRNRVWSLRLTFVFCGINVTTARMMRVGPDGVPQPWEYINPGLTIFQWSQELPFSPGEETHYELHDLLTDYAQTIYIVQLIGKSIDGTKEFSKFFWVTPAGISNNQIERPEIRKNRFTEPWSQEDSTKLTQWYAEHEWGSTVFAREFRGLTHMSDKKIDIQVEVRGSGCMEEK